MLVKEKLEGLAHLLALSSVTAAVVFMTATAIRSSETLAPPQEIDFQLVPGAERQAVSELSLQSTDLDNEANPALIVVSRSDQPIAAYESPDSERTPTLHVPVGPSGETTFLAVLAAHEMFGEWSERTVQGQWIEVYLPVRPNGSTGWIKLEDTRLHTNRFRIEVDRSRFMLRIYEFDQLIREADVAIGTGSTPTPAGTFYTTELIETVDPEGPYGPYAFALSGYSETISDFNGGPGIIGVHGTNEASAIGTAVSFGCIRVENEVVEFMAATLPVGTPIEIS